MGNRFAKRNIIILILLIITTIAGIIFFVRLVKNKKALEENLYTYIPIDVSSVLQINDKSSLSKLIPAKERLMPVITALESNLSFPLLFIEYDNSLYIISKVTDEQENLIEEKLQNTLFPYYQAKQIKYKEVELFLYTTSENDFFVYMLYNGFMVGGYNINLFQKVIDADINSNKIMSNSPLSKEMLSYMKKHYPANIFLNNSDCFSVFNIDFNDGKIELEGYDTHILNNDWVCGENEEAVKINYSIFPDSLKYYEIEMYNPIVTDSFRCLFEPPSYSFKMPNQKEDIYALKHIDDKYKVYSILNELEAKHSGNKFETNDFYEGHRIYTASKGFSKEVLGADNEFYMVFYRDYLFLSKDKNVLKFYLKRNGEYKPDDNNEIDLSNIVSISYSSNINRWYPAVISAENPVSHQNKGAYIMSFFEDARRKTRILINN